MRSLLRTALLVLILVTVAMASAVAAMHFAIHGREVRVPKLAGLTRMDAERSLASAGLGMNVENSFYSVEVPPGLVLSQYPPPYDKVRRGWRVRVALSLGAQVSAVPELVGESERAAQLEMRRRGFDITRTASLPRSDSTQAGTVIAQSPQATAQPIATPKISLLVSTPEEPQGFVMPVLVGRSGTVATEMVRGAGFKLEEKSAIATSPETPVGNVIAQEPQAGTRIARGMVVTISIAQPLLPLPAPPSGAGNGDKQ